MINDKEFVKQFEELRSWIRESVLAFDDSDPRMKEERLRRAAEDKIYFAETYFPHYCTNKFAQVHKELFKLADTYNKPVVIAGTRELAKSTIVSFLDEMHKTLFRVNKFTAFLCDTQETAAAEFMLPIRAELEENQRVICDFGKLLTKYCSMTDMILKSGKRMLAIGPKMGAKGKRYKGSRIDRWIIEDLENRNSPKRKAILKRRLDFLLKDVMNSVNFKKWQFIFLGNYFSKKTVIHMLLTDERFKHWVRRVYPALVPDKNGKLKSIWEDRLPLKDLLRKQSKDPLVFRVEQLQKPDDEESIFKEEWFDTNRKFDYADIEKKNLPVVTYFDPSAQKGEEHCYKAIIAVAVDKAEMKYYVIHARIRKESKWSAVEAHFDISQQFKSVADGVEANGFQSTLEEDYEIVEKRRKKRLNLKKLTSKLPKEVRISRLSSMIERGVILFPRTEGHNDMNELIEEFIDFPDGEYEDGPDALEGAIQLADSAVLRLTKQVKVEVLG